MFATALAQATPEQTAPGATAPHSTAPQIAASQITASQSTAANDDAMTGDIVTDSTKAPNVVEREAINEHRLGIAAYKAGQFEAARAHYLRSLSLLPHYQTAALLGQVEAALGRHPQAAEYFALSLSLVPRGEDASRPQAALAEAKHHVHTLNVVTHQFADLTITVDGSPLAKPRPRGDGVIELFLSPGSHDVSFDKPGFVTQQHTLEGSAGTTLVVHVNLLPTPESSPADTAKLTPTTPPATSGQSSVTARTPAPYETHFEHYWPVYLGGIATLGAVGVGTYLGVKANRADRALTRLENSNRDEVDQCSTAPEPLPEACQALHDRADIRDAQYRWSMVGFVTAGVLGAATVGTLVWLVNTDQTTRVTPSIGARHLAVVVEHHF